MLLETFFPDALMPHLTTGYYVTQRLRDLFPGRHVLETRGHLPFVEFGLAGGCVLTLKEAPAPELIATWAGLDHDILRTVSNGCMRSPGKGGIWRPSFLAAVTTSGSSWSRTPVRSRRTFTSPCKSGIWARIVRCWSSTGMGGTRTRLCSRRSREPPLTA